MSTVLTFAQFIVDKNPPRSWGDLPGVGPRVYDWACAECIVGYRDASPVPGFRCTPHLAASLLSNPTSSVSTEGVADGLSEAWAAAEAALPEGWAIDTLDHGRLITDPDRLDWMVTAGRAIARDNWRTGDYEVAWGDTPEAALQALAARLTAINPDSPVEPDRG